MGRHRDITPVLQVIRSLLQGKKTLLQHRFADSIAPRTQPQPNLPPGPYARTSKIYYFTRDARREVQPPIEVFSSKQITSGSTTDKKLITPGKEYVG